MSNEEEGDSLGIEEAVDVSSLQDLVGWREGVV